MPQKTRENKPTLLDIRLLQTEKLQAVATLAGGVAHNFNNTLTVILGHTNLMLEKIGDDDDSRRHIDIIKEAAGRAALLVRQLLVFSRRPPFDRRVVSLNDIVQDMQLLLAATCNNHLELKLTPEIASINADPSQIGKMLMSLVMNAREAMPDGGRVTIETAMLSPEQILLRITDTGSGMSPEICARIFDPFFTTKPMAQASGLGLSTVYGIVQQHGGSIEVSSNPGDGTVFSIVLPAAGED